MSLLSLLLVPVAALAITVRDGYSTHDQLENLREQKVCQRQGADELAGIAATLEKMDAEELRAQENLKMLAAKIAEHKEFVRKAKLSEALILAEKSEIIALPRESRRVFPEGPSFRELFSNEADEEDARARPLVLQIIMARLETIIAARANSEEAIAPIALQFEKTEETLQSLRSGREQAVLAKERSEKKAKNGCN
jgi:hypothetical protein